MYFSKKISSIFITIILFNLNSYVHTLSNDTEIRNIKHNKILKDPPNASVNDELNNPAIKRDANNTVPSNGTPNTPEPIAVDKVSEINNTTKKDLNKQIEVPKVETVIKDPELPVVDNSTENSVSHNTTSATDKSAQTSGAKRRAFIVFGSLGLFALIYFVYKMYRRRRKMGDISFIYDTGDLQQFKYGMLLSNEAGDTVEMLAPDSMELNADSDDEEELFDLERRKQFRSNDYKDLHTNDRLLARDVDILDIELPGVRSSSDPLTDNDLLNLDDAVDEILRKPTNPNFTNNDKNFKNDDFFNAL